MQPFVPHQKLMYPVLYIASALLTQGQIRVTRRTPFPLAPLRAQRSLVALADARRTSAQRWHDMHQHGHFLDERPCQFDQFEVEGPQHHRLTSQLDYRRRLPRGELYDRSYPVFKHTVSLTWPGAAPTRGGQSRDPREASRAPGPCMQEESENKPGNIR